MDRENSCQENSFSDEENQGCRDPSEERKYFTPYPTTSRYFTRVAGFFKKLGNGISNAISGVSKFVSERKQAFERNYPQSFQRASNFKVKANKSFGNLKEWFHEKVHPESNQISPELSQGTEETIEISDKDLEIGLGLDFVAFDKHFDKETMNKIHSSFVEAINSNKSDVTSDSSDVTSRASDVTSHASDEIVIIVRDSDTGPLGNEEVVYIGDNEGLSEDSENYEC